MDIPEFASTFTRLTDSIGLTVRGDGQATRLTLTCLFAKGHVLIEDRPGLGKTTLARTVAESLGVVMKRIQFTPDLLPTDITGTDFLDREGRQAEFRRGPVFANVVLADEINRASPKTQSALLEVMEERQVSFGTRTHKVPADPDDLAKKWEPGKPYVVLATQNPVDADGTYPLPAAQLDRFLMSFGMGFPGRSAELRILRSDGERDPVPGAGRRFVVSGETVTRMIETAKTVIVSDPVLDYVQDIVEATRALADGDQGKAGPLRLGVSPRGGLALVRAARVRAAAAGRDHVLPEDVQALVEPVLAHRLVLGYGPDDRTAKEILADVVRQVEAPL